MDQILEKYNLQKLTQEGGNNINRIIFIKEVESIFNKLPKEKAPGPNGFTGVGEFCHIFEEKHINSLQSLPECKSRENTS